MRLDKNDTNIILSTIESIFGNVKVYLFGSRLDEQKRWRYRFIHCIRRKI